MKIPNGVVWGISAGLVGIIFNIIAFFAVNYFHGTTRNEDAKTNSEILLMNQNVNQFNEKIDKVYDKVNTLQDEIINLKLNTHDRWSRSNQADYSNRQRDIDEAQNRLLQDLQNRVKQIESHQ